MGSAEASDPPRPEAVREVLGDVGEDPGELELKEIEGGASRQTFLVAADGEPRWVLRREPAEGMSFAPLGIELRAIAAADARRGRGGADASPPSPPAGGSDPGPAT